MLDYVLFDEKPFQLFVDWLKTKGLQPEINIEEEQYEIRLPEDLDDDLLDEIDEQYDMFMDMNYC